MSIQVNGWGVGKHIPIDVKYLGYEGVRFTHRSAIDGSERVLQIASESLPKLARFLQQAASRSVSESLSNAAASALIDLEYAEKHTDREAVTAARAKLDALQYAVKLAESVQ